jgi:predicted NAD-dependent protein-ADP-ribosyltransferase YbiA (DUF1768 family)
MNSKYSFFWKPQGNLGFCSQWAKSSFAEHWMMWRKAKLFGDDKIAKKNTGN